MLDVKVRTTSSVNTAITRVLRAKLAFEFCITYGLVNLAYVCRYLSIDLYLSIAADFVFCLRYRSITQTGMIADAIKINK